MVQDKREDVLVRGGAAAALGQAGQGEKGVVDTLLQVADEPALRNAALGALWDILARGQGERPDSVASLG